MKTKKINNYGRLSIILISILLLFSNCQNETDSEPLANQYNLKTEIQTKSQFSNKVKLISKIKKISDIIIKKKENKSVYSNLYDFTIQTEFALYVEFDDGTFSYTFPITRDIPTNEVENFVLTSTTDGSLRAQYFKYELTQEEITALGSEPIPSDKITIITVDDDDLILEVNQNKYDGDDDSGWSWGIIGGYWATNLYDYQRREVWVDVYGWVYNDNTDFPGGDPCYNCDGGGSDDNFDGSGPGNSYGNSGNNNTGTTGFSLQILIDLNNALVQDLTGEQFAWIFQSEENHSAALQILDYLNANPGSASAQNFAQNAFDALMNDGEVDFEDRIIVLLNEREKCIYNLIKDTPLYKQTIGVFEQESDFYLTIDDGDCDSPIADMCTNPADVSNGCITIYVQNYLDSLEFAAAMLHEGIHAEIFKYVEEHLNGIDPQNREQLLYYYFFYKVEDGSSLNTAVAQHQYMANNFVTPIAETIRALDNNQYPLDYYMGFGWDGLRKYGYDGYYDNGNWISLDKSTSTTYFQNQATVMSNTNFANNCN